MIAPIVSLEHWRGHRADPGVVTADVRSYLDGRDPEAEFARRHLPGAVLVDLDRRLAAPPSPADGRHPLPDPAAFAAALGELGIGDDDVVLAYDDQGGVVAARLVWMLRVLGHEAALLDGGLLAWDGPVGEGPAEARAPAATAARPWPAEVLADAGAAADEAAVVIDAREPARFSGETEPIDPRPGRIPGARNVPCRLNVDPDGRLLPDSVLRQRFAAAGAADPGARVVSYCGSGVTACHTLLVLEHLGLGPGRLYPGSYSQWSHTDRPVAVGP